MRGLALLAALRLHESELLPDKWTADGGRSECPRDLDGCPAIPWHARENSETEWTYIWVSLKTYFHYTSPHHRRTEHTTDKTDAVAHVPDQWKMCTGLKQQLGPQHWDSYDVWLLLLLLLRESERDRTDGPSRRAHAKRSVLAQIQIRPNKAWNDCCVL